MYQSSTASDVIADFRSEEPSIEDFRDMWKTIRNSNRNIVDALRVANLAAQINDLGVGMEFVEKTVEIVNRFGDKAEEGVSSAIELSDRAKSSGKNYDQIVSEEQSYGTMSRL